MFFPAPGLRLSVGYTYKNWSFTLESGFNKLTGKNMTLTQINFDPLVLSIWVVPIITGVSYDFIFFNRLYLTPKINIGAIITRANHYKSVFDLLQKRQSITNDAGFTASLDLQIGFSAIPGKLIVYAGTSIDLLPESTINTLPLPSIQMGIRIYPAKFMQNNKSVKKENTDNTDKNIPPMEIPIYILR